MPKAKTCRICSSPKRRFIDKAIVSGKSLRFISAQFHTTQSTLQRHKAHIRRAVAKAREKAEITNGLTVWHKLENLVIEAEKQYKRNKGMLKATWFREIRGTIEMGIKLGVEAHRQQQVYQDVSPAVLRMIEEVKK